MYAFAQSLGKEPITAPDRPGFIVNRLLVPYLLDAIRAYENGLGTLEDIDKGMKLGCGYPMGPFTLLDFVGLDTTYYIANIMFEEFREPAYAPPPLLKRMVLAGYHGRKSGRGFYSLMPKILRSPLVWIAIGAVGTLAPMMIPNGAGWPVSLLALCLFSVAGPLTSALGENWWLHTFLTGLAWVVTFVAVGETPGVKAVRELAMVYLLPMMIYPVAVGVSGIIRMTRWRKRGHVQPPPVQV